MKIKKFNTVAATILLGGALLIPSAASYLVLRPLMSSGAAMASAVTVLAGDQANVGKFSAEGKQVTNVAWRSRQGEMPGETTLKKWVSGDRTYYEISGPINRHFASRGAAWNTGWGSYFACEVFFARGGDTYDQWIINPAQSAIYHFASPMKFTGQSTLTSSRYQIRVSGDRAFISFWCHNGDTPRNIVFNYNHSVGDQPSNLSWVTTHIHQSNQVWNHHDPASWTDP